MSHAPRSLRARGSRAVSGTTTTGTGASAASASDSDPSATACQVPRPCEPTTIALASAATLARGAARQRRRDEPAGAAMTSLMGVRSGPIGVDGDGLQLELHVLGQASSEAHGPLRRIRAVQTAHDTTARRADQEPMSRRHGGDDHDWTRSGPRERAGNTAQHRQPRTARDRANRRPGARSAATRLHTYSALTGRRTAPWSRAQCLRAFPRRPRASGCFRNRIPPLQLAQSGVAVGKRRWIVHDVDEDELAAKFTCKPGCDPSCRARHVRVVDATHDRLIHLRHDLLAGHTRLIRSAATSARSAYFYLGREPTPPTALRSAARDRVRRTSAARSRGLGMRSTERRRRGTGRAANRAHLSEHGVACERAR